MSELATLARPYAEAAFKRAKETDSAEKWSEMLGFLTRVMEDPTMSAAARSPKLDRGKFQGLLLDVCADQLNDEGRNFVRLLVEFDRLSLLGSISDLFENYKAEDEGCLEVDVTTAYPLSGKSEHQLSSALEQALARKVRLRVTEDKSLIGGVLVRAGDKVIDGSIRGQLEKMARKLDS